MITCKRFREFKGLIKSKLINSWSTLAGLDTLMIPRIAEKGVKVFNRFTVSKC
jgi:hypothetical protein